MDKLTTFIFAPQLYIQSGITSIDFYTHAFDAIEIKRWSNDDGSIHVAELSVHGSIFHLHEVSAAAGRHSPLVTGSTSVLIGLFVPDVHASMKKAIAAGATEISPVQDFDYGYRQGEIKDPFGHSWLIQMII